MTLPGYDTWKTTVPDEWDREDEEDLGYCQRHSEWYRKEYGCTRCDLEIDNYLDR